MSWRGEAIAVDPAVSTGCSNAEEEIVPIELSNDD